MRRVRTMALTAAAAALLWTAPAWAVQRFPPPDFESGYKQPVMTRPRPRAGWEEAGDEVLLGAFLAGAAWLAVKRRSRLGIALLGAGALAYFGFWVGGCICPIGSIQNVTLALAGGDRLPVSVLLIFLLPLVFALAYGRVFCGAVCPLGAIQDVVLLRPVRVPDWLAHALSVVPFFYLGLAVLMAATDSLFVICRFDPFVGIFRLAGPLPMLAAGGLLLLLATVVGRPYCRFLCPYGALLGLMSRFASRKVTITPDDCVVCGLCEDACPFGAIEAPTPQGVPDQ